MEEDLGEEKGKLYISIENTSMNNKTLAHNNSRFTVHYLLMLILRIHWMIVMLRESIKTEVLSK